MNHLSELMLERLRVWDANTGLEDCAALMLHFLLTWASRGSFSHNGSAAQACARLHDAIYSFTPDTTFERVSASPYLSFFSFSVVQ